MQRDSNNNAAQVNQLLPNQTQTKWKTLAVILQH